ncbi:MAG: O-antigen ligase family protein [bacterium]
MKISAAAAAQKNEKERFLWLVLKRGLLLVALYIPFGVALNLSPEVDLASLRVAIMLFFLAWLSAAVVWRKAIFAFSLQGIGLIAILAISGFSLFLANELGWGLRKELLFLSVFPLFFVVERLTENRKDAKGAVDVLMAGAVISSLIAIGQFLAQFFIGSSWVANFYSKTIGPIFWGRTFSELVASTPSWFYDAGGRTLMRAFGLFPDPHMLSFFLGLILPLAFARFLFTKRKNLLLLSVICLLFAALLLTFSRGGYLGILASLLAIIFLSWRLLPEKQKWLIWAAAALALVIIVIVAPSVLSRFVSSFVADEGSSLGRLEIWQESWQVFLKNPLLGVGLGNYPRAVDAIAPYRSPITSHNLYLDILSETGIFGLAAWTFLLFGTIWQFAGRAKKELVEKDPGAAIKIGLMGSLIYFSVHSFFETAIFNPAILATLMIILALAAVSLCHKKDGYLA